MFDFFTCCWGRRRWVIISKYASAIMGGSICRYKRCFVTNRWFAMYLCWFEGMLAQCCWLHCVVLYFRGIPDRWFIRLIKSILKRPCCSDYLVAVLLPIMLAVMVSYVLFSSFMARIHDCNVHLVMMSSWLWCLCFVYSSFTYTDPYTFLSACACVFVQDSSGGECRHSIQRGTYISDSDVIIR